MTKLQWLCLAALEDMTLKELNERYFDNGGIGYTKKVIAGTAKPVEFIQEAYSKRFEEKYQSMYKTYMEFKNSFKGW